MKLLLGEILIELNVITRKSLNLALEEQVSTGQKLGELLVHRNACSIEDVSSALTLQRLKKLKEQNINKFLKNVFLFFSSIIKNNKEVSFLYVLFSVFTSVLSFPIIFSVLINFLNLNVDTATNEIFYVLIIFSILTFLGVVFNHIVYLCSTNLTHSYCKRLSNELLEKISTFPSGINSRIGREFMYQRMTVNLENIRRCCQFLLPGVVVPIFFFVCVFSFLIYTSITLSALVIFAMLLTMWLPIQFIKNSRRYIVKEAESLTNIKTYLNESFNQKEILKISYSNRLIQKYSGIVNHYHKNQYIKSILMACSINARQNLTYILMILIIFIGGLLVFKNHLKLVELLSFYFIIASTMPILTQLNRSYGLFFELLANLEEIQKILKYPSIEFNSNTSEYLFSSNLSVNNVEIPIGVNRNVNLRSLRFEFGKTYIVTGESGSGKSRFLKTIASLEAFPNDDITIDGVNLNNLEKANYWKNVSYMPQDINSLYMYSLTDCEDKELALLTIGERQLKTLNSYISQNQQIQLYDEPTSNISIKKHKKLYYNLIKASPNCLKIIATHDDDIIKKAENLIVFENDKVIVKNINFNNIDLVNVS